MNTWLELGGEPVNITELAEHLRAEPEWSVEERDGKRCLQGSALEAAETIAVASTLAEQFLEAINLSWKLHTSRALDVRVVGGFRETEGGGGDHLLSPDSATLTLSLSSPSIEVSGENAEPTPSARISDANLILCTVHDPVVAEALDLFTEYRDNWTQLCNIIEIVIRDQGEIPSTWASGSKINKLRRTAQFAETAGATARHRGNRGSPPSNPMPLTEAQMIVKTILREWMRSKAS